MTDREKMIEKNLGLVHSCARKFMNRGIDYDDLFQAGCVGLVKAVDGFDSALGYEFSTYAVPAVLGEIKRVFRDGGTVKVSRGIKEKARFVYKQKEEFSSKTGREPTVTELAELVGLDVYETSRLLLATQPVLSLTVSEDEKDSQLDVPVEGEEAKIDEKICLDECLAALSEKDRKIIDLRYYKAKTQTVVAKELGMSQVQVSRREKKILKEIREKMSV